MSPTSMYEAPASTRSAMASRISTEIAPFLERKAVQTLCARMELTVAGERKGLLLQHSGVRPPALLEHTAGCV
jgi:hypothetical protein